MSAIRTFALAVLSVATFAGSARAQGADASPQNSAAGRHRGHHDRRGQHSQAMKDLNLSESQRMQMDSIRAKYRPQLQAFREQARPFLEAARDARQKGDTAAFRANAKKAREISSGIRKQEKNEIGAVLTAEQRTRVEAARAQRREERGRRGHGGRRGKPQP